MWKDQGLKFYDAEWNNKRNTLYAEKYPLLILHRRRIWNSHSLAFLHEQMAMITSPKWLDTKLDKEACGKWMSIFAWITFELLLPFKWINISPLDLK